MEEQSDGMIRGHCCITHLYPPPTNGTMSAMPRDAEERQLIARDVRPDSRKRVSLGAALDDLGDASFSVYRDSRGRIILEPHVSIPAAEAWLFRNRVARESLARGLKQIESAKPIGSFAAYAGDDET